MLTIGETGGVRKQYHFWPGEDGLDAWDVDRLVEQSVGLRAEDVRVDEIAEIDSAYWFDERERPTVRNLVEHMRLVHEVDMSFPIIIGPDGRVMDGMHRIAKVLLDGGTTISAVRLKELPPPDHRSCRPDELPY